MDIDRIFFSLYFQTVFPQFGKGFASYTVTYAPISTIHDEQEKILKLQLHTGLLTIRYTKPHPNVAVPESDMHHADADYLEMEVWNVSATLNDAEVYKGTFRLIIDPSAQYTIDDFNESHHSVITEGTWIKEIEDASKIISKDMEIMGATYQLEKTKNHHAKIDKKLEEVRNKKKEE